jgi:hypothetical protein
MLEDLTAGNEDLVPIKYTVPLVGTSLLLLDLMSLMSSICISIIARQTNFASLVGPYRKTLYI